MANLRSVRREESAGIRVRMLVATLVAGAALMTGCGGGDEEESTTASTSSTTSTTTTTEVELDENGYPPLAYVQPLIGHVPEGIELDGREGTPPEAPGETDLEAAAEAASCELQLDLPDEGNAHFADEDKEVDYETSPPTSGDHYAGNESGSGALADGAYLETPAITRVVHSQEHGRVVIHYSPDLSEEEQLEIKGVFEEDPAGAILIPNADMPYEVAVTAWTQLVGCGEYEGATTLDVVAAFRDVYRGKGPERFPIEL